MHRVIIITLAGIISAMSAGCANPETATTPTGSTTNPTNNATPAPPTPSASEPGTTGHTANADDVPANVRAVFPDAQSFATQHRDLSEATISSIEKETGNKVVDRDHHAYLAFGMGSGGARRQIGAATVVKAGGQELIVVYDSKDGSPVIREVRGGDLPASFFDQFKGKGHDDALAFGNDIKTARTPDAEAQTATAAIKADVLAMQALYGSAHTH